MAKEELLRQIEEHENLLRQLREQADLESDIDDELDTAPKATIKRADGTVARDWAYWTKMRREQPREYERGINERRRTEDLQLLGSARFWNKGE